MDEMLRNMCLLHGHWIRFRALPLTEPAIYSLDSWKQNGLPKRVDQGIGYWKMSFSILILGSYQGHLEQHYHMTKYAQ